MFGETNVKKSGHNSFSKYDYFELGDIVPPKTKIFNELGLCDIITFSDDVATLTLVNIEDPTQQLVFTSPMRSLELKGANAVQLLGGVETYQRRYLYMAVLDIVEADQFDGMSPAKKTITKKPTSSFTDEVVRIVSSLPEADRKNAGEIVKKYNNGSANFKEITDPRTQETIINALKEAYHV